MDHDFFVRNYKSSIFEDGMRLRDMLRLRMRLRSPSLPKRLLWFAMTLTVWMVSGALMLGGLLFALLAVYGMVDPQGAQMSNDADPFGKPPDFAAGGLLLLLSVGVSLVGAHCSYVFIVRLEGAIINRRQQEIRRFLPVFYSPSALTHQL